LEGDDLKAKLDEGRWPSELKRRPIRQNRFAIPTKDTNLQVTGYTDENYPPLLKHIPDPPLVLFYKGSIQALAGASIAIIGARRCTTNGRIMAQQIAADLALQKICIVSGLALGIDTAAHLGALSQQGATVAFLGCGLDRIYPASNKQLAQQIIHQGGGLVSEYPLQTPPMAHHFPERNRLISGASMAAVVIEASEKSGSLITARMALEQGRDVYAVPGPASSEVSRGCHRLIQQGAGLVINAQDLLTELPTLGVASVAQPSAQATPEILSGLSAVAALVLDQLTGYGQDLDELAALTAQHPHETSLALVELELAGFVRHGGDGYIRAS
jgi:DNA processing protein